MFHKFGQKMLVGIVGLGALVGVGAAVAATQIGSPKEESQAIVNDAAQQLGIEPSRLSDALKKALANRVDAAVTAGGLTEAQGNELKARIAADEFPLFIVGGHRGGLGHKADLTTAASYLGLSEAELRSQLESGKTLAEIARDRSKSVDGLIQALVDAKTNELEGAVAAGRLTEAQKEAILSELKQRITDRVNGVVPSFRHRGPGVPPAGTVAPAA
jgi:hypothetical protein